MDLRELYQAVILDHNRSPRNFGELPEATHQAEGHNPLCGDRFTVALRLLGGRLDAVRFSGSGCAISKASASLMTEVVGGRNRDDIAEIVRGFVGLAKGDPAADPNAMGKLAVFAGVSEFPMRVKCATLAWHTLEGALNGVAKNVSTES